MAELQNNLINITNKDLVYKLKAKQLRKEYADAFEAWQEGDDHLLLRNLLPQIDIIATDAYYTHYSVVPILRSSKNPDEFLEKARKFMSEYMESKDYRNVKIITTLNDELSKIYSHSLIKAIIQQLLKNMPNDLREKLSNIGSKYHQQLLQGNQPQLSSSEKQVLQQAMNAINNIVKDKNTFQQVMKHALKQAQQTVQNAKDIQQLVGGKQAGKEAGSYEKLLKLTLDTLWNVNFREIITTAGKIVESMPQFVSISKERDKHGDELWGYRTTRKPWNAIPRELALPDEVFEAKLTSNGLLSQEKVITKEGSYYVIIDKSGSMGGEKTRWARSVALAIFKLARMKRRKYFLRFFDEHVHPSEPIENPYDALDAILSIGSDGGTSIDNAIYTAVRDLKDRRLNQFTNTIILITDGKDNVGVQPTLLKRYNVQLVAIMIQGENETLKNLAISSGGKYLKARLSPKGGCLVVEEVM